MFSRLYTKNVYAAASSCTSRLCIVGIQCRLSGRSCEANSCLGSRQLVCCFSTLQLEIRGPESEDSACVRYGIGGMPGTHLRSVASLQPTRGAQGFIGGVVHCTQQFYFMPRRNAQSKCNVRHIVHLMQFKISLTKLFAMHMCIYIYLDKFMYRNICIYKYIYDSLLNEPTLIP